MAATAAQIARVAAWVPNTFNLTEVTTAIEHFPLLDERGIAPYSWNTATTPPTQEATVGWIPTYDLHAAAAELWESVAAGLTGQFDFSDAGGQSFRRSQEYEQAMKQVRYHVARRAPKSVSSAAWPRPRNYDAMVWIGNLPESDDE